MREKLSGAELASALAELNNRGWVAHGDASAVKKSFRFKNFSEAFGWMARAALAAEKLNHHPDWSNTYNQVEVLLTTHSAGGLTNLDVRLAKAMDKLSAETG